MNKGKLYLIPNVIADQTQHADIPARVLDLLPTIKHFLAEDVRTARRYLSSLKVYSSIEDLHFEVLDKDTGPSELKTLFQPVLEGSHIGILSESGCPGVADPGALAVKYAHENSIQVIPLVGPSSILLALMGSGLNGQSFAFNGYLPIESKGLAKAIRDFEKESRLKNQTQIFIETPYRSNSLFQSLIGTLHDETLLCVALEITGQSEEIKTYSIRKWKTLKKELQRAPAVFLFLAI